MGGVVINCFVTGGRGELISFLLLFLLSSVFVAKNHLIYT